MAVTSFIVRRLGPGDEPALRACARDDHRFEEPQGRTVPSAPLDREAAAAFLRDPSVLFWLAEEAEGRAIGMLLCYVQRRRSGDAWAELSLYEIGIDVDWRRRGVGRALLDAMHRWMGAHGVREVWVPSAPGAVGFYRACGFEPDEAVLLSRRVG
jgi:ribosomal protein S18 acetylase RimI-like enzyme